MKLSNIVLLERIFNSAALLAIIAILVTSFIYQIFFHELPCPLCLLQRVGLLLSTYGFLLNLRYGFRASHYALTLLAALFTASVALRQILLHIVPGTGSYGTAVFGIHMYTWAFVAAVMIIITTTIMLGVDRQYEKIKLNSKWQWTTRLFYLLILLLIFCNIISTFLLCGITTCPDNPTSYKFLQ